MTLATSAAPAVPATRRRGRPAGTRNHPRFKALKSDDYAQRLRTFSSWLIQARRRLRRGCPVWTAALEYEAVVLAVNAAQLVDQVRAARPDAGRTTR